MFTGEYLRVADQVYGPGTVFAAYALLSPYGASVWATGPTVSVAVVGQIMPAVGPPESSCGPPPRPKAKSEAPESAQPPQPPVKSPPSPTPATTDRHSRSHRTARQPQHFVVIRRQP
jgi:hypothetical protein